MEQIDEMLTNAERAFASGALETARDGYKAVLAQAPEHPVPHFQLGAIAIQRGDNMAASDHFAVARRGLPHLAATHHNFAVSLRRLNRHSEALSPLRQALLLEPDSGGAMLALSESESALDQLEPAIDHARRAVILSPASAEARCTLAHVFWRAERLSEAETTAHAVLAMQPNHRRARFTLANVATSRADLETAVTGYRTLAREDPAEPSAWHNLAVALLRADRLEQAAEAFHHHARLLHGRPENHTDTTDPMPNMPIEPVRPANRLTCWHRLKQHRDQLIHLTTLGKLDPNWRGEIDAYQSILDGLSEEERAAVSFSLSDARYERIKASYNRCVFRDDSHWPADKPTLSDKIDWDAQQAAFMKAEPPALAVDGFLNPDALAALRRFCRNSTIWFATKGAGYLGAYLRAGFNDPVLIKIAQDLREKMPRVLGPHPLTTAWAYSYEQSMVGINPHADFAEVNVNFWITEDDANLNSGTGGLVVYPKAAPLDWGFNEYNCATAETIHDYLGSDRERYLRIPHKANRMLLFDSRLFHETDRIEFASGFTNRRINITLLYGERG